MPRFGTLPCFAALLAALALPIEASAALDSTLTKLADADPPSAPCFDLDNVVPDSPVDSRLPEGWFVQTAGSEAAAYDSSSITYGAWHVVRSLRQNALSPAATATFEVLTPSGGFEVVYALYPFEGNEADPAVRETLAAAVRGRGIAARFYGRVLLSAATRDRKALTVLGNALQKSMSEQARRFAEDAEKRGDVRAVTRCVEEFLSADPRNAPMHLSLGLFLLDRADPREPARGLASLTRSLSRDMSPGLSSSQRWKALHAKGTAELLLSENRRALASLTEAVALAPDEAEKAASQFNLAAAEASAGDPARALELLRESFTTNRRLGRPTGASAAAQDMAFKPFADDPEFIRLLGEFGH